VRDGPSTTSPIMYATPPLIVRVCAQAWFEDVPEELPGLGDVLLYQ